MSDYDLLTIFSVGIAILALSRESLRWREADYLSQLPASIQNIDAIPCFKTAVKNGHGHGQTNDSCAFGPEPSLNNNSFL